MLLPDAAVHLDLQPLRGSIKETLGLETTRSMPWRPLCLRPHPGVSG